MVAGLTDGVQDLQRPHHRPVCGPRNSLDLLVHPDAVDLHPHRLVRSSLPQHAGLVSGCAGYVASLMLRVVGDDDESVVLRFMHVPHAPCQSMFPHASCLCTLSAHSIHAPLHACMRAGTF